MQDFVFAKSWGIYRVDISTDGGESWSAATLSPSFSTPGPCGAIHGNYNDLLIIIFWLERLVELENNNPRKNICNFRIGYPADMK